MTNDIEKIANHIKLAMNFHYSDRANDSLFEMMSIIDRTLSSGKGISIVEKDTNKNIFSYTPKNKVFADGVYIAKIKEIRNVHDGELCWSDWNEDKQEKNTLEIVLDVEDNITNTIEVFVMRVVSFNQRYEKYADLYNELQNAIRQYKKQNIIGCSIRIIVKDNDIKSIKAIDSE